MPAPLRFIEPTPTLAAEADAVVIGGPLADVTIFVGEKTSALRVDTFVVVEMRGAPFRGETLTTRNIGVECMGEIHEVRAPHGIECLQQG